MAEQIKKRQEKRLTSAMVELEKAKLKLDEIRLLYENISNPENKIKLQIAQDFYNEKRNILDQIEKGEGFTNIYEGKGGNGSMYAHSYRIPLYMSQNLPIPKLQQNEMHLHPQTASSYASDYYNRGYGPSLKGVHITNAPLVMNGKIMYGTQKAGCENCGLKNFRKKNLV